MKKSKIYFLFLIFAFACSVLALPTKNIAFAENSNYIKISDISQITDMSANYVLTSDVIVSSSTYVGGTFTGTLNGNGHTISGELTTPIFEKLGSGAEVTNIRFGNLSGETITNCIFKIQENASISEENFGLVAKVAQSATISQIFVTSVEIKTDVTEGEGAKVHSLLNNTNIGFVVGKALDGSNISNCFVQNSKINVNIGDTVATEFNFGGIAGKLENSRCSNNIVNLLQTQDAEVIPTINITTSFNKTINFGGIAGFSDYDKTYFYNNVVVLDQNSTSVSNVCETKNIGSCVGCLNYKLAENNVEGFVTTHQSPYFGNYQDGNISYAKLIKTNYNELSSSIYQDNLLWNDREENNWNFSSIWVNRAGEKFPSLQCFENYGVSFDAEESLKSLNLEVMPTIEGNDYSQVIASYLSANTLPTDSSESSLDAVEYNSDIYIKVKISEEKNYNKFFYIAGLQLNGRTIYDNEKGEQSSDISVEVVSFDNDTSEYIYKVNNFNANCEGVYNVLLGRQTYKIKVKVHDLGSQETGSLIPGKFKTNSETNPIEEKVLNMQYGERFVLSSYVTNSDYSDKVSWFIYDNSQEDVFGEPVIFAPNEDNANFYANKIDFTFNETSSIFKGQNEDEKTYFSFAEYAEELDENQNIQSNYELILVYNKRVKQVKIVFRLENGDEVNQKLANLLIDDKSDRLTWNEDDGVYYAKVAFDRGNTSEYVIDIETMSTEYEFLSWSFDIGKLAGVEGDDIAGIFEISEDTEEPLTIYCDVKLSKENVGGNLLWLWITLGVIALVAIIIVIIIIVKKRRGGGSSYKKYYY